MEKVVSFSNCVEEEGKSQETSFKSDESFSSDHSNGSQGGRPKNHAHRNSKTPKKEAPRQSAPKVEPPVPIIQEKSRKMNLLPPPVDVHQGKPLNQTPEKYPQKSEDLPQLITLQIPKESSSQVSGTSPDIVIRDNQGSSKMLEKFRSDDDATPTFERAGEKSLSTPLTAFQQLAQQTVSPPPQAKPNLMSKLLGEGPTQVKATSQSYNYEDMEYCKRRMVNGLKAKKFHYSQKGSEPCIVMISEDKKRLYWQYTGHKRNKKSDCSMKDVTGIAYGALSGTFYQYRSEIIRYMLHQNLNTGLEELTNSDHREETPLQMIDQTKLILKRLQSGMSNEEPPFDKEPFYAWQCVTLYLPHKTLDLVFEEDESLFVFISFMQAEIIERINIDRLRKLVGKKSLFGSILKSTQPKQGLNCGKNSTQVSPFVPAKPEPMRNFRLMKFKMKIAYSALKSGQPILDFIINAIIKAYIEHGIPKNGEKSYLDDDKVFSWRVAFLGEKFQRENPLPRFGSLLEDQESGGSPRVKSPRTKLGSKKLATTPEISRLNISQNDLTRPQDVQAKKLSEKNFSEESKHGQKIPNFKPIETSSLESEDLPDNEELESLKNEDVKYRGPRSSIFIQDSVSHIPDAHQNDQFDDVSKEGLRKILIEAASVTNKDDDDQDDTIATTFNLETCSPTTTHRNKVTSVPTVNWLQKARQGEFSVHSIGKVLKIDKKGTNKAGAELYRIYDSEEDVENQETVVLHPALNEVPEEMTVKNKKDRVKPSFHPAPKERSKPQKPQLQENMLKVQTQNSDVVKQFTFNHQKNLEENSSNNPSAQQPEDRNEARLLSVHVDDRYGFTQTSELVNKQYSNFPRRSKTGCYDKKAQDKEDDEEIGKLQSESNKIEEEAYVPGPLDKVETIPQRKSLKVEIKGIVSPGDPRLYQLDTDHFKIQSELIRANDKDNSQFDQDDNDKLLLLEADNIPEEGLEFGERKLTFFRRAKTQKSPHNLSNASDAKRSGAPQLQDEPSPFTRAVNPLADHESDPKMMLELNMLEQLFKMITRNSIENPDMFDKNVQARSSAYKFYQTVEVFKFHRLHDYKELFGAQALQYLRGVKQFLVKNPAKKAHILRKNLVILGRKERDQIQKLHEEELKQRLLESEEERQHLKLIQQQRDNNKIVKDDNGIGQWFRLACMKCMGTKTPQDFAKEKLARQRNQHSPDKAAKSRSNSPTKSSPHKSGQHPMKRMTNSSQRIADAAGALFNDAASAQPLEEQCESTQNNGNNVFEMRTIHSLLKKQSSDVNNLYQAVKLVSKFQEAKDDVKEQLRLKQIMNLKARGFFLDNADEMSKIELREKTEREERVQAYKRRKQELLRMLEENEEGDSKSQIAVEEVNEIGKSIVVGDQQQQERQAAIRLRNQKLRRLQELLYQNADEEFDVFIEEFKATKRPIRKIQLITDRLNKEEMYFNPILNRLGQFKLVRQLRNQRTKSSGNNKTLKSELHHSQKSEGHMDRSHSQIVLNQSRLSARPSMMSFPQGSFLAIGLTGNVGPQNSSSANSLHQQPLPKHQGTSLFHMANQMKYNKIMSKK